jgi:hypothetical protein
MDSEMLIGKERGAIVLTNSDRTAEDCSCYSHCEDKSGRALPHPCPIIVAIRFGVRRFRSVRDGSL